MDRKDVLALSSAEVPYTDCAVHGTGTGKVAVDVKHNAIDCEVKM